MADNAIMVRRQNGGGDGGGAKITLEFLEDYARQLNRMNFTVAQGIHWFVNERKTPDGEVQRYLDNRKVFEGLDSPARPIRSAGRNLRVPYREQ